MNTKSAATTFPSVASRSRFLVLAFVISGFCLAFASRGLFSGYSYWLDELFSVSASADTWPRLYSKWILPDVHPPLYQIILKLWIFIAGSSEVATRVLSFFFSAITLIFFSLEAVRTCDLRRIIALFLVGASPAFAFYSQETRSYGMVLMLSSVVTISALNLIDRGQGESFSESGVWRARPDLLCYISCIALSLTHYFGWIYVFSISVVNLWGGFEEKSKIKTFGLIAAISIWPAWHILNGQLLGKTGGNFWIKVVPIMGTINAYLQGCLPPLTLGTLSSYLLWSLIIFLSVVSLGTWGAIKKFVFQPSCLDSPARESRFLLAVVVLTVALVAVVDIRTPMSTDRNFIVALPPTMIILANSIWALPSTIRDGDANLARVSSSFLAISICFALLKYSNAGILEKLTPRENWKQLAHYVQESRVCSSGCLAIETSWELHKFYFHEDKSGPVTNLSASSAVSGSAHLPRELQWQLISKYKQQPVMGFHTAAAKTAPEILKQVPNSVCLRPKQSWGNNVFIVVPKALLSGREYELGMQNCVDQ